MSGIAIRLHAFVSTLWQDIKNERGQDLLEYALIGGFISVALVIAFTATNVLDLGVQSMVDSIAACVDFQASDCGITGP